MVPKNRIFPENKRAKARKAVEAANRLLEAFRKEVKRHNEEESK
jgi:hypothetical protein